MYGFIHFISGDFFLVQAPQAIYLIILSDQSNFILFRNLQCGMRVTNERRSKWCFFIRSTLMFIAFDAMLQMPAHTVIIIK